MDEVLKDERFKHISKDARFRIMPKNERKFKVDRRFKNMFHDKKFKLKYSVDKRGRPINLTTNDNLKKFYELSESEEEEEGGEEEDEENDKEDNEKEKKKNEKKLIEKPIKKKKELKEKKPPSALPAVESESDDDDDEDQKEEVEKEEAPAEDKESSGSDEDEDESDSESDDDDDDDDDESSVDEESDENEIPWNEFDKDTQRSDTISTRLALCNMDWDRIKASDLFILLNSFKTNNGVIKSIKIYPSEFGKERMEYERLHGPQEFSQVNENNEPNENENKNNQVANNEQDEIELKKRRYYDEDDDQDEGDNFDRLKLRKYQFNRLRYYYAIVECDSCETANKIYTECDGMEYESSCTRLDLRFVPDDLVFDDKEAKDICQEAPDPLTFKPNLFFTTALNQTKVECTWDETPRDRLNLTMKKFSEDELKSLDFKKVLATSSEEEDNDEHEEDNKANDKNEIKNKKNTKQKSSSRDVSAKDVPNQVANDEDKDGINKYRSLLLGSGGGDKSKKKREGDLEFSWEGGMEEEGFNEDLFNEKKPSSKRSNRKSNDKKQLTEEEQKEQAQLSLLTMDDDEGKAHFNLDDLLIDNNKNKKGKKNKKLSKNEENENSKLADDFKLNVEDPRFGAIFSDHRFNIDPSDKSFKKTKAMEELVEQKLKRKLESADKQQEEQQDDVVTNQNSSLPPATTTSKSVKFDPSASLMIKSIKSKTEILNKKKSENEKKFNFNKKLKN